MSDTKIVVTTKEELPSFIQRKHDLDGVIKKLEAGSKDAAEMLIKMMNDPKLDDKMRAACAKDILTFFASMTDQRSKDQMNRMIAEIKVKPGGVTRNLTVEDDKSKTPVLDFNTVREI